VSIPEIAPSAPARGDKEASDSRTTSSCKALARRCAASSGLPLLMRRRISIGRSTGTTAAAACGTGPPSAGVSSSSCSEADDADKELGPSSSEPDEAPFFLGFELEMRKFSMPHPFSAVSIALTPNFSHALPPPLPSCEDTSCDEGGLRDELE
jgi:hypothetical protein